MDVINFIFSLAACLIFIGVPVAFWWHRKVQAEKIQAMNTWEIEDLEKEPEEPIVHEDTTDGNPGVSNIEKENNNAY